MTLKGKHILLGVTGGIAAYKSPILVRHLRQAGAEVQAVLTESAAEFVTPVTLQAVSGHPVRDSLWDQQAEAAMGHIELARWADAIVIAPATAHCIATLAQGLAGDLLSTLCLATRAPIVLAPAMNQAMWEHPATRRNLDRLRADGAQIIGPATGEQACGEHGPGRMVEPEAMLPVLTALLAPPQLAGLKVLITAGPTREPLDPVRYLTNRSSGKQGYALAAAAHNAGADVTLISGPCALAPPSGVTCIDVETAQEMREAVMTRAAEQALFIAVAAVADFRPQSQAAEKIKKQPGRIPESIALVENPDIVADVAALGRRPVVIGFAAETDAALQNAREKRQRKGLDGIVVNDVSNRDIGFNSDYNAATLIWSGGEVELPYQGKTELAANLIQRLAQIYFPESGSEPQSTAPPAEPTLALYRQES